MPLRFLFLFGLVAIAGVGALGCRSTSPSPSAAPDPRATERAAAEGFLRELFPEVEGPLTRETIERALTRPRDGTHGAAIAAIGAGDYERAKQLLDEIVAEEQRQRARSLLVEGDARGALAVLDRAVDLAPRNVEVRTLRAEAALRVGEEDRERVLVEAARTDFLRAAQSANDGSAWLGASRAALWLADGDAALEYARAGMRALASGPTGDAPLVAPARTLAEASLAVFASAREAKGIAEATGADVEAIDAAQRRMAECFEESRSALETLIGSVPEDPWSWERLAWLHEAQGAPAQAQRVALSGLAIRPRDEALHQRLSSSSVALGGVEMLAAAYGRFRERHADIALAEWYPAVAEFDAAVERFTAGEDARELFASAESSFARCRGLDVQYARACLEYEVLCRSGAGWCQYRAGSLEAAHQAFLSMEDSFAGGLGWHLGDKLPSGIEGLHFVGGAYAKRGGDSDSLQSIDDVARAAKVYDFLHAYQPDVVDWANNAGFFNRDVAVALEQKARVIAGLGRIEEGNRLLDRAREGMERSYRAYVDAARLAPQDVRIQNDTGLILTYYLQRDVDVAEQYLMTALHLGEAQVPELRQSAQAPGLDRAAQEALTDRLEAVEIAVGDVYQNLGVLYLTLRNDPVRAKVWLEKSLVTGPDPRVEVKGPGGYLDQCAHALSGTPLPQTRWGAPLAPRPAH